MPRERGSHLASSQPSWPLRLRLALCAVALATGLSGCTRVSGRGDFSLTIIPQEVLDATAGQPCVLLIEAESAPRAVSDPVLLRVDCDGAEITPLAQRVAGEGVVEFTVTPRTHSATSTLTVSAIGARTGTVRVWTSSLRITAPLSAGAEASLKEQAARIRDAFLPWLALACPDLPDRQSTEWVGVPLRPHRLVVSHFAFFSKEWEIVVWWHVTVPPHDWARIYVRRRSVDASPAAAAEISSFLHGSPIRPTTPPAEVVR